MPSARSPLHKELHLASLLQLPVPADVESGHNIGQQVPISTRWMLSLSGRERIARRVKGGMAPSSAWETGPKQLNVEVAPFT